MSSLYIDRDEGKAGTLKLRPTLGSSQRFGLRQRLSSSSCKLLALNIELRLSVVGDGLLNECGIVTLLVMAGRGLGYCDSWSIHWEMIVTAQLAMQRLRDTTRPQTVLW